MGMLSRLLLFGWMTIATSGSVMRSSRSVVMTRVERVCSGSSQCLTFSSCSVLKGRNKQDTLQAIRQLQCGFSGNSPMVCCPVPSLPRKKAVGDGGNVNVNANDKVEIVDARVVARQESAHLRDLELSGVRHRGRTVRFPFPFLRLWRGRGVDGKLLVRRVVHVVPPVHLSRGIAVVVALALAQTEEHFRHLLFGPSLRGGQVFQQR